MQGCFDSSSVAPAPAGSLSMTEVKNHFELTRPVRGRSSIDTERSAPLIIDH